MPANVEGTRALLRAAHGRRRGADRLLQQRRRARPDRRRHARRRADAGRPTKIIGVYKTIEIRAEQVVLRPRAAEGIPAVIVNPAAPVGPRDIKPTPTGRMIADAAAGRMPAYVETGLNIVHVDDVAEGHALALERGVVGERYILGGENMAHGGRCWRWWTR